MKSLVCMLLGFLQVSAVALGQTQFVRYAGNPILGPGSPGAWDAAVIAGPCVVYRAPTYYMWYATFNQIGYATSSDGIQWTRYVGNPVLGAGSPGSFDGDGVRFCRVYDDGKAFHMQYTGMLAGKRQIGYAYSLDGKSWAKHPQPVFRAAEGGPWEAAGVAPGTFTREDSGWTMWYVGLSAGSRWNTGIARSKDSINWVRAGGNPVLSGGPTGTWDQNEQAVDCVVKAGNQYHLWYDNGNNVPYSIGYASSLDGSTWGTSSKNPIVSADGRGQVLYPWVIRWPDGHWEMWYTRLLGGIQYFDYAVDSPTGFILLNPMALDFDPTPGGQHRDTLVVTIMNYGRQSAQITNLTLGSLNFSMVNRPTLPYTLDSSKSYDLRVAFTPTRQGILLDSLVIASNAPSTLRRVVALKGGTTSVSEHANSGSPSGFRLEQNYPNPFNPATVISFQLPSASDVRIVVSDLLGREVGVLVDERKAAGNYEVNFNAVGLASGVYLVRLQAGSYVQSRKMVLTK